ncbi:MAG: MgtC/SapB family protein [Planctomycetota bacterium]|nr:MgtC/SapB family protein [Planctomycetota bacterium]
MQSPLLLPIFLQFGLAALLGFLIGLERGMQADEHPQRGLRDFVLVALLGAVSALVAEQCGSFWVVIAGFLGALILLVFGLWRTYATHHEQDKGITTEVAALLTFFLGVLVMQGRSTIAIALTIAILAVLTEKEVLHTLQRRVQRFELEAALKLLVITFIVLPLLPREPLSRYLLLPLGQVSKVDPSSGDVVIEETQDQRFEPSQTLALYDESGRSLGTVRVVDGADERLTVRFPEALPDRLEPGVGLRAELAIPCVATMLDALVPYRVWLIVVLVSAISFVGYVLVKTLGGRLGSGVTGIVGGLASSTVTTMSFARRSRETPAGNRHFAVAVILASSVMFPRLLVQIGVVNQALMRNLLVPIGAMGLVGLLAAGICYWRCQTETATSDALELTNPFRLGAAFKFAVVFTLTLMLTHLAISDLGSGWLPLVSLVSGLPDADAVAFSMSQAERAGLISLDWAGFNVVLGALANTFMKLLLVLLLGHRDLFKQLLPIFLLIAATGIVTTFCYYDLFAPAA